MKLRSASLRRPAGLLRFHSFNEISMIIKTDLRPNAQTRADGEIRIRRDITFRASTFDALAAHRRAIAESTGWMPSNAAAVDRLIRAQLLGGAA
jgi:hypothetical protein